MANELQVDAVEYAFAETGFPDDDFGLWSRYPSDKGLGIGVIDIKRLVVETPEQIIVGVRKALEHLPRNGSTSRPTAASSRCPARSRAASSRR